MIETAYVAIGVVIGVAGVLGIQWIYNWIDGLRRQVERLRMELDHYTTMRDRWVEFNFWKKEQQDK